MVKEIYSLGRYIFYSAEELAEFKLNFPNNWEEVQNKPLKKWYNAKEFSGLSRLFG